MDLKLILISVACVYLVTPAAATSLAAQDALADGVGLSGASLKSKRSVVYVQTQSGIIQQGIPVKNEQGDIIGVIPPHASFFDKICNLFSGISTMVSKKVSATGDFISSLFGKPQYVLVAVNTTSTTTTSTTTEKSTTTTKKQKCTTEHGRNVDESEEDGEDEEDELALNY